MGRSTKRAGRVLLSAMFVGGVVAATACGGSGNTDPPQLTLAPVDNIQCVDPGVLAKINVRLPRGAKCDVAEILFSGSGSKTPAKIESRTDIDANTTVVVMSAIVPDTIQTGIIHTFCDGKEKDGVTIRVPCDKPADAGPDGSACVVADSMKNALGLFLVTNACSLLGPLSISLFEHSATSIGAKAVANDHTTEKAFGAKKVTLDAAAAGKVGAELRCGDGKHGKTLCPPGAAPITPGDYLVSAVQVAKAFPKADPKYYYQLGFVFDVNGQAADNYAAAAQYKDDLYKNTDRWYEALYAPGPGWSMKASNAHGTAITALSGSAARIVLGEDWILFFAPTSEITSMTPSVLMRSSIFRHPGDFGTPSNDYDGSVYPAVDQPLYSVPIGPATDGGVDAGPTSPATARTITAADNVSGIAPGGDDAGHWFKYVPTQAFTSVDIAVTAFGTGPSLGTMRWQTSPTLGLCNIMGGVVCCNDGPASCHLSITDVGGGPVVVGQTYWIIVLGGNAGQTTSYAFSLVENP